MLDSGEDNPSFGPVQDISKWAEWNNPKNSENRIWVIYLYPFFLYVSISMYIQMIKIITLYYFI